MSSVTHPAHYNTGKIEVIEAIEDWKLQYHRGNAVKYIARAGRKDPSKEIEDLEKAAWYLNREIENLKAAKEGREPTRPNDMNPKKDPNRYAYPKYWSPNLPPPSTSVIDAWNSGQLAPPLETVRHVIRMEARSFITNNDTENRRIIYQIDEVKTFDAIIEHAVDCYEAGYFRGLTKQWENESGAV